MLFQGKLLLSAEAPGLYQLALKYNKLRKSIMKKIFFTAAAIFLLASAGSIKADEISFVWNSNGETIQGVDGDTSGWSNNGSTVNLHTNTWDLLGGTGSVNAYTNCNSSILSQTGTRGLGIFGGRENDEIDTGLFRQEKLEITFDQPTYLNSLEVRSLFYEPIICNFGYSEIGTADLWLGDNKLFSQGLIGVENIRVNGTDGSAIYTYDQPYLIDKLVFYVPRCELKTLVSDFSVAKLNVSTAPEPISTILFLTGGSVMGLRIYRKKRNKSNKETVK